MIGSDKRSQRDYRVFREYTDNHGRRFEAQADSVNNQPIGELMPKGFTPPWLPPMRFARFSKVGDLHFTWDYDTMADELGGVTAAYYKDAVIFALENHKPEPEVGGPVDRSIRFVFGAPPLSPAIPLAAKAGIPWILGIPGAVVVPELKAILEQSHGANGREALELIKTQVKGHIGPDAVPTIHYPDAQESAPKTINDAAAITYNDFLSEARKRGMSMADAALAWKAHKENIAETKVA